MRPGGRHTGAFSGVSPQAIFFGLQPDTLLAVAISNPGRPVDEPSMIRPMTVALAAQAFVNSRRRRTQQALSP